MTTVASLFDGIGGTPLAARISGAECLWCSEIEEFPQMVTKHHFPSMKHYGDITKINGAKVEPVDIIVGGSPCQDLSVAGKRQGMKHSDFGDEETTRSGLFMEQMRIVKEMRNATETNQPRFMVWENVPGAFSSRGSGNKLEKGDAFRIVLEETAKIKDETISIPRPVGGKWANAGCIMGDGFSIAWRTVDAQYWGVAQRRRRIYLVADFGGQSAPEILFEQPCVSGHSAESGSEGQGATEDVERSTCFAIDHVITTGGHCTAQGPCVKEDGPMFTLKAGGAHAVCCGISAYASNSMKSSNPHSGIYEADTSRTIDVSGGNPACNQGGIVIVARMQSFDGDYAVDGTASALKARDYKDATDLVVKPQGGVYGQTSKANTREVLRMLQEEIGEKAVAEWGFRVIVALQQKKILRQEMYGKVILQTRNGIKVLGHDSLEGKTEEVARQMRDLSETECQRCSPQGRKPSEQLIGQFAAYMQKLSQQDSPKEKYLQDLWEASQGTWVLRETLPEIQKIWESICVQKKSTYANGSVRRLTAKECCRLQGYPDDYTNIPGASDTARYKALGNSFAIPNILFVMKRCVEVMRCEQ